MVHEQEVCPLMAGTDPELRASGAFVLLAWEALVWALRQPGLRYFDFMGSMIEPVERVRRDFEASQIPFFRVGYLRWKWLGIFLNRKI
ncbi:MAG: GNAT family N-acetyltransferase [Saprospiraceae bacterium]|nr:GNAT family N-acetyltransferase [Saprospiraceae bacterium]